MVVLSTEGPLAPPLPHPLLLLLLLLSLAGVLQDAEDFLVQMVTSTELWEENTSIGTVSKLEIR